jgi:hypothetical protein
MTEPRLIERYYIVFNIREIHREIDLRSCLVTNLRATLTIIRPYTRPTNH